MVVVVVAVAWWALPASAPKECLVPAGEIGLKACTEHSASGGLLEGHSRGPWALKGDTVSAWAEEVRERFMEEEDPLWKGELEWGQDRVRIWCMHPSLPTSVGFAYHPLISKNPDKSCSRHCHLCLTYRCEAQHRVRKPVPGTSALGGSCT